MLEKRSRRTGVRPAGRNVQSPRIHRTRDRLIPGFKMKQSSQNRRNCAVGVKAPITTHRLREPEKGVLASEKVNWKFFGLLQSRSSRRGFATLA